jgi:hypothetical protein
MSFLQDAQSLVLFKYQIKEPTTQAEMLNLVVRSHQDYFPAIFDRASEYIQLVLGIDVKKVDPTDHSYILVPVVGLTYDGMLSDTQGCPIQAF